MSKTTLATVADHQKAIGTWHLIDASEHILGRMASRIAEILMGKHLPLYTPHISVGESVIVINAAKVGISGTKRERRIYHYYTGYPGGLRDRSLGDYVTENPEQLIKNAVRRMLPKNRIGHDMLRRLKVYAGQEHPHSAQQPKLLEIHSR